MRTIGAVQQILRLVEQTEAGKVSQILLNLLSNAIKCRGEVRLTVRVHDEGVELQGMDTGCGITAEMHERCSIAFSR